MAAPLPNGHQLVFLLSPGRTGTTFLYRVLPKLVPEVRIVQEPPHSRAILILGNAAMAGIMPSSAAIGVFLAARRRQAATLRAGHCRLEINPLLLPITDRLPELAEGLRVIQMVRDPRDWIVSIANFGAAGWRRPMDGWPFTHTIHPLVRRDWSRLDVIRRGAWRWRFAYEQIGRCLEGAADSTTVRYEDLFAADEELRLRSIQQIISIVSPETRVDPAEVPWDDRINPSAPRGVSEWHRWSPDTQREVDAICADLMEHFGYERRA